MPIYYLLNSDAIPLNLDGFDQTYIAEPIFEEMPEYDTGTNTTGYRH